MFPVKRTEQFEPGFNPFGDEFRERLNAVAFSAAEFDRLKLMIERKVREPPVEQIRYKFPFPARINGSVLLENETNRYGYSWYEVQQSPDGLTWVQKPDGRSGQAVAPDPDADPPVVGWALNFAEVANGDLSANYGDTLVPDAGPNDDATITMKPIQTASIVMMRLFTSTVPTHWFEATNALDVVCVEPEPPPP